MKKSEIREMIREELMKENTEFGEDLSKLDAKEINKLRTLLGKQLGSLNSGLTYSSVQIAKIIDNKGKMIKELNTA